LQRNNKNKKYGGNIKKPGERKKTLDGKIDS
jgi:hypothetical protein